VSCAKTAEQTEMPFRMLCRMDPRNHVWDGIQIPAGRDNFEGGGMPRHVRRHSDVNYAKNGLTGRDAVWVMDSVGPKEACIIWGPDPHANRQLLAERTCQGMPDDTLP